MDEWVFARVFIAQHPLAQRSPVLPHVAACSPSGHATTLRAGLDAAKCTQLQSESCGLRNWVLPRAIPADCAGSLGFSPLLMGNTPEPSTR